MPISPARIAAFDILLRVEQSGAFASELLHSAQYKTLSRQDHALTTELVLGSLRWRLSLDSEIARFSSQKLGKLDLEVLTSLRIAVYQLRYLERVPARAATHESVELVRRAGKQSAAPFVNAVLRKIATASPEERPASSEDCVTVGFLAEHFAHPPWLLERWAQYFDTLQIQQICAYDQRHPQVAVRGVTPELQSQLRKKGVELEPGILLKYSHRLRSGDITKSSAFRQKQISIQDEGSQLVALLGGKAKRILDCCAAPGGKTRILAERNPQARITAVELHPHRARLLKKLVPLKNVEVVNADILAFRSDHGFDLVLADVPCSGTGTLARNPEIKWRLKPEDIVDLHQRQLAILKAAIKHATSGGKVIYSTCSLEPEENSEVVKEILGEESVTLLDCSEELKHLQEEGDLEWNDTASLIDGPYFRTIPGVHSCDGYFAAVLKKT